MHKLNNKYALAKMELQDIKQIVIDQKKELDDSMKRERVIEREVLDDYKKHANYALIKVIQGVRRCGKSTLCYQLLKDKNFAYVNFDDERLASLETEDLNKVLESFYEIYEKFEFILLDEVQNVYGWELFVNRLKRQGLNVVLTGSNARLLSKELSTHLTGRHIPLELFPFSFREFLKYRGLEFNIKSLTTEDKGLIKNKFNEYAQKGGFPEALKESVIAETYLRSLYSTIINKDVVLRNKVKYVKTLKDIASYLISNHSCQMSFNKIKNVFGLRSTHTALNYVSYLEESYLFFFLKRLSYKHKESLIANRKNYVIDTGLINALSVKFSQNKGRLYENIAAIELLRKKSLKDSDIFYWQDIHKNEVDFVIKQGMKTSQLIQVCYDPSDLVTKERETRSLLKASKELKCENLIMLTEDKRGEEKADGKSIRLIPLWEWLLEED